MRVYLLGALVLGLTMIGFAYPEDEPATPPISPESELTVVQTFITQQVQLYVSTGGKAGLSGDDASNLRFFTNYAVPQQLRGDCDAALSFVLNSTSSPDANDIIVVPKKLTATVSYIDIRDYGWDNKRVDAVFTIQPYFLAPLVTQPGSLLFRADWFIANATDVTLQDDRGLKIFPYYTLQYGLNNDPKNAADFQNNWSVDIKTIRGKQVERGLIVDAGESGVSRHTRQLRRGRTTYGYYWETRDVKTHVLDPLKLDVRDYIEDIFANFADAGEYITSNKRRLQTYLLTAGNAQKFKEVKFGDPTIVWDKSEREDIRVRTAKGCMVCHAVGINPGSNALQELFQKLGGDILTQDKNLYRLIQAFYLQDTDGDIKDDNSLYERAVKACNGLTPLKNAQAYLNVYSWYVSKVTLEQAAVETGLCTEDYKKKIKPTTGGRLVYLYNGKPIPREVWDDLNGGGYVQSMLFIKGISAIPVQAEKVEPQKIVPKGPPPYSATVAVATVPVYSYEKAVLEVLRSGDTVTVTIDSDSKWYRVRTAKGVEGYVERSQMSPP
jgi:hypothetical protein